MNINNEGNMSKTIFACYFIFCWLISVFNLKKIHQQTKITPSKKLNLKNYEKFQTNNLH